MAIPTTKATFKTYCKIAQGYGVIDINVSEEQVEYRVEQA